MIRPLGLIVVLATTLTIAAMVVVFIASSGDQFERRLVHHWGLGQLDLAGTHMEDLNSIGFEAVRVKASPVIEAPFLVQLDRVSWRREDWLPRARLVDDTLLVFQSGRVHLEKRDGTGWNLQDISSDAPAQWIQKLPAEATGTDVDLLLTRIAPRFRADLQLRLEDIEWQRRSSGARGKRRSVD